MVFQKSFCFKITNKTLRTRSKQQISHTCIFYISKVSISQGIHSSHAFQFEQIWAIFFFVPVLTRLILTDSFKTCDLRFLKRIRTGGATLTPAMHDRVFKIFRKYHNYHHDIYPIITSGYGATEFGSLVYECGHFSPANKKINTVGKKVINQSVQAKIGWFQTFLIKTYQFFEIILRFSNFFSVSFPCVNLTIGEVQWFGISWAAKLCDFDKLWSLDV